MKIESYFEELENETHEAYKIASKARSKKYDPSDKPEIVLAKNLAERVIGLISVVAPQLGDSGAIKRIAELEKEFGALDWRVAFQISLDIAQEKFCKFKDKREAMEVGIRSGFAYVTLGAVSAPLEGFTKLEIKQRNDGKGEYFCLNFSGPIRAAGGTAAAVCVLIADFIRNKMGYAIYDPTEQEIKRCHSELTDYHEWITNLQYFPSKEEEIDFLIAHVPIEISGDPSEKYEISNVNLKDLPRVPTNRIRSGYCLVYSAALPLKAPKVWVKLSKWASAFDMDHWSFLEEFLKIQKTAKARDGSDKNKNSVSSNSGSVIIDAPKIKPDFTYIADLVAGRPVFGHPQRNGAFRLRYGRSRTSGYSAQSIHPASMEVLLDFIAIGTQLKVERPGKAAAFTSCDTIDGPIVKLKNGSVLFLESQKEAKQIKNDIQEIIYLGDVLINYGDFYDRAHPLIPSGYVQEEWSMEFERAALNLFGTLDANKISDLVDISPEKINLLFSKPLTTKISFKAAHQISKRFFIPLHPSHILFWNSIKTDDLVTLLEWINTSAEFFIGEDEFKIVIPTSEHKRQLELIGLPHQLINNEFVVIEGENAKSFLGNIGLVGKVGFSEKLDYLKKLSFDSKKTLDIINLLSDVCIMDKCGTFIGSRMGRPEKAKIRKMTGSPQVLFPVGNEGGKFRSFQSTLEKGFINSRFAPFFCKNCKKETVFSVCEFCDKPTEPKMFCEKCGLINKDVKIGSDLNEEGKSIPYHMIGKDKCFGKITFYKNMKFNIKEAFPLLLQKINTSIFPDLIKGVKGTSNSEHIPEHLIKGILRAKHRLYVNKDGTVRYDCSEIPITHFKPKETGVSIDKLKKLGYDKDIKGKLLESEEQILEMKPQDMFLPCNLVSLEEPADEILFRTANFVDELLQKLYGMKPFYNLKSKEDLVGQLVIGLAPHTSAGILCRIIGFSKTQGFLAHPYVHAAMRRDCDGDEGCILLLMDAFLNFSKKYLPESRGSTMDAPLVLTYILTPAEVDDMAFNMDIVWKYPIELYEAARQYKSPGEIKLKQIGKVLRTPLQYEKMGFTHDTNNINDGVLCSAYKTIPSMEDKLKGQMELAEKIRAVDTSDVARLVIDKHLMKDTKGNLRKFSQQEFRCVECNEKFRRPPLSGKCSVCGGKLLFTVSEGFVVKYLALSKALAEKYHVSNYMLQTLELLKHRVESVFGKDKERQEGLGAWLN